MKVYEWNTEDGRFQASRDVMRLEQKGSVEEANALRELLQEAIVAYQAPEYYVLKDMKNKQIVLLYGNRGFMEVNEFDKFIYAHIDNYICHVNLGCTWIEGMICQQCEPTITAKKFEKWHVFETEDGQLWFEQM